MSRAWRGGVAIAMLGLLSACVGQGQTATEVEPRQPTPTAAGVVAEPTPFELLPSSPIPVPEPTRVGPTPLALPTATPTPTPLPIESRTLLFSGDVLSHTPVIGQAQRYGVESGWAYDYRPMFAAVAERVKRADLAICVLETPVSVDNQGLDGYPTFNAPRELPDALIDAGYDGCATASNHSMDRGPSGVSTTLDQMDRVGLGHAGMARSADEWERPRIYELDGVTVAHLSTTYGLNGFVLPAEEPWLVNLNSVTAIDAEAQRARAAGADVVVLSIQWGNEYQRDPSDQQRDLAVALTASGGLDLIVGNHAHVVQPVDVVNGTPVIYGLGNSLSNQYDTPARTGTQDGVMIEVTVRGSRDVGFEVEELRFAPTWVDRSNYTIVDLTLELARSELDGGLRTIYQQSFDRTAEAILLLDASVASAN